MAGRGRELECRECCEVGMYMGISRCSTGAGIVTGFAN
jgi:hypothetical protein